MVLRAVRDSDENPSTRKMGDALRILAHAGEEGLLTTELGNRLDVEDMAGMLGAFGKRVSTRYGMESRLLVRKRESVNGKQVTRIRMLPEDQEMIRTAWPDAPAGRE